MYPYTAPNQNNIKKQGPTWLHNVFDKCYGVCLDCLIAEEKQTTLEPKFKASTSGVDYSTHMQVCMSVYLNG